MNKVIFCEVNYSKITCLFWVFVKLSQGLYKHNGYMYRAYKFSFIWDKPLQQCFEVNEASQFITDKNTEFHLQYEINNCQQRKQALNLISGTTEAATAISFHPFEVYKDRQQTPTLQKLPKMFLITFLNFLKCKLKTLTHSKKCFYFQHFEAVMVYYFALDSMSIIYNSKQS